MTGNRPTRPGNAPQPLPRPPRPGDPSRQPPQENRPKGGNGGGNQPRGGGGGRGGNNSQPSPWLGHPLDPTPNPDPTAGFVEYLRWMRAPLDASKDGTKAELAHQVETTINLGARLKVLNERTQRIASDTFQVTCPWRIRVGGAKGPESMLLPAFDPLGIPYIPSSTLRGVARSQAIRELMQERNLSWEQADKAVAPWFGHLQADEKDRAGKVIFLDAYPVPTRPQRREDPDNSKTGGSSCRYCQ